MSSRRSKSRSPTIWLPRDSSAVQRGGHKGGVDAGAGAGADACQDSADRHGDDVGQSHPVTSVVFLCDSEATAGCARCVGRETLGRESASLALDRCVDIAMRDSEMGEAVLEGEGLSSPPPAACLDNDASMVCGWSLWLSRSMFTSRSAWSARTIFENPSIQGAPEGGRTHVEMVLRARAREVLSMAPTGPGKEVKRTVVVWTADPGLLEILSDAPASLRIVVRPLTRIASIAAMDIAKTKADAPLGTTCGWFVKTGDLRTGHNVDLVAALVKKADARTSLESTTSISVSYSLSPHPHIPDHVLARKVASSTGAVVGVNSSRNGTDVLLSFWLPTTGSKSSPPPTIFLLQAMFPEANIRATTSPTFHLHAAWMTVCSAFPLLFRSVPTPSLMDAACPIRGQAEALTTNATPSILTSIATWTIQCGANGEVFNPMALFTTPCGGVRFSMFQNTTDLAIIARAKWDILQAADGKV